MNRIVILFALAGAFGSAGAEAKKLICTMTGESNAKQNLNVYLDDSLPNAEVAIYSDENDCAKENRCPSQVYERTNLPTKVRLTRLEPHMEFSERFRFELSRVIDIDKKSLRVDARYSTKSRSGEGNTVTTFSGWCAMQKDITKDLL